MSHAQALRLLAYLMEEKSTFRDSLRVLFPDLDTLIASAQLQLDAPKLNGKMEMSRKQLSEIFIAFGSALKPNNPDEARGIQSLRLS